MIKHLRDLLLPCLVRVWAGRHTSEAQMETVGIWLHEGAVNVIAGILAALGHRPGKREVVVAITLGD